MKNFKIKWYLILLIILNFNYCSKTESITTPINHPPKAFIILESDTVVINNIVSMSCSVEDPDENESFTYNWLSFKVTENSTEEDYEINTGENGGQFIKRGVNARWTPSLADGKYLIFCYVQDKDYESVLALKIINVINFSDVFALTDANYYNAEEQSEFYNLLFYIIRNNSQYIIEMNICGSPHSVLEEKNYNNWITYSENDCVLRTKIQLFPDEEMVANDYIPKKSGLFRYKYKYDILETGEKNQQFFSNEFQVLK
jgi:hypothetical protein